MSIQAVGWALDQDLPARPKLVLVAIANHANHTDGYCWLKAETIAQEASCSPRAVFNFIGDLIRNGYVRKAPRRGEDGKQRANDYWILLDRMPFDWIPASRIEIEREDDTPEDTDGDGDQPQDIDEPDAPRAYGENEPAEGNLPAGAVGPHAPVCSHKGSAEPSKIKPKDARARGRVPRGYQRPVPEQPQPVASIVGRAAEWVFVFKPSKAYDAWAAVKSKENGRPFGAQDWREGRLGWYFPSLFPPGVVLPPSEIMTEQDAKEFAKTW